MTNDEPGIPLLHDVYLYSLSSVNRRDTCISSIATAQKVKICVVLNGALDHVRTV